VLIFFSCLFCCDVCVDEIFYFGWSMVTRYWTICCTMIFKHSPREYLNKNNVNIISFMSCCCFDSYTYFIEMLKGWFISMFFFCCLFDCCFQFSFIILIKDNCSNLSEIIELLLMHVARADPTSACFEMTLVNVVWFEKLYKQGTKVSEHFCYHTHSWL
jgi:hypothetical protein